MQPVVEQDLVLDVSESIVPFRQILLNLEIALLLHILLNILNNQLWLALRYPSLHIRHNDMLALEISICRVARPCQHRIGILVRVAIIFITRRFFRHRSQSLLACEQSLVAHLLPLLL